MRRRSVRLIGKVILLWLMTLVSVASHALAQNAPDRPLVSVTGQAEILVVPDEVVFKVRASTLDKNLLTAQHRNDEIVKKVIALARGFGIPSNLIQTDHIALEERHSDEDATRKPSVFLGYHVTKKIAIVLRDVTKAEALLSEFFKSGVTSIEGVDFRSTQMRKHKDQARALAIKAAQEKASAFARELGQSIGKAFSITEEGVANPYAANVTSNFSRRLIGSYSDESTTIALGQISITARVMVSFELK